MTAVSLPNLVKTKGMFHQFRFLSFFYFANKFLIIFSIQNPGDVLKIFVECFFGIGREKTDEISKLYNLTLIISTVSV